MTTKVSKSEDPMDVYPVIELATKAGRVSKFRVIQIQTKTSTQIVVRNAKGRKLFDMEIQGLTIVLSVPVDAEIQVEPSPRGKNERDT